MAYAQYPVNETISVEGGMVSHLFATDTHWIIAKAMDVTNVSIGQNVEDCSLSDVEVEAKAKEVVGEDDLLHYLQPIGVQPAGDTELGSGLVE